MGEWLWNWTVGEGQKNFKAHDRKNLDFLKQIVSKNIDF